MDFEDFIGEWRNDTPYIIANTSGSTGLPKIIRLDKDFVKTSALRTNRYFGIGKDSRLHSCVAADFIGGKMMAVRSEVAGCRLSWERPSNRPLAGIDREEKIDLLAVVPSQMVHIVENRVRMPRLENIIIGGSAINPILYDRICESGLNAYETYGMTETSSHIALRKVASGSRWFETLPGITVAADDRGCLIISFATGERFVTNDIAEVEGQTRFMIKGRHDQIIITGGKKVNPYEVEEKLASCIRQPFVVTSQADIKWGSAVVLKIEGERQGESSDDELRMVMRRLLEPHEVPKVIEHVAMLPRTENGKIKR